MADITFNIALGRLRQYYDCVDLNLVIATGPVQSTANSALIVVLLEATGLEADGTLRDYDDLAALLAGTSNEQTTMGRKTLTDTDLAASAQDDTNNRLDLTAANITWLAAAGNPTGKLLLCFDSDTTAGTDSTIVPLLGYDFAETPTGSDITAQINANGLVRITG